MSSFAAGDGGVFICGTWLVDTYDQEAKKDGALANGYAVTAFPQIYPGSPRVWADGHSWVLLKQDLSEAQRASAIEFMKFLWDNNYEWARTGHLPIRKSIIDSDQFKALPFRADLAPLAVNGTALPSAVKRQFSIQDIEGEEVGSAMRGDKSIDQALADAESRINELLANAK